MLILASRRQRLVYASPHSKSLVDVRALTRTRATWLAAATSFVPLSLSSCRPGAPRVIAVLMLPEYKFCTRLLPSDCNLGGTSCSRSDRGIFFTGDFIRPPLIHQNWQ